MVLLIRRSPCTSSGKWRLDTISRPEVGRTLCLSSIRLKDLCVATPYRGLIEPGIIHLTSGPEVSAKKCWPQSSKMMPQGLGIDSCAVRSRCLLEGDRKSTRLNSSHVKISYAVY